MGLKITLFIELELVRDNYRDEFALTYAFNCSRHFKL